MGRRNRNRLMQWRARLFSKFQPIGSRIHVGRRSVCYVDMRDGKRQVRKVFSDTPAGRAAFASERLANDLFTGYDWMSSWTDEGELWYTHPMYAAKKRLDYVAKNMGHTERIAVAGQALSVLLDLYERGYAHRDLNSRNLYLVDEKLKLIDFEFLHPYPSVSIPNFTASYDITGLGLESPGYTKNMAFMSTRPPSVSSVLGVTLEDSLNALRALLIEELREASLSFTTARSRGRHQCRSGRIYSSFELPMLRVEASEAQRNCAQRFGRFGITRESLKGRRILDLGSNIGGMLFQAQHFKPRESVGVEVDPEKVRIAKRVAAFNNLRSVRFTEGDVDSITIEEVGGPFDVVFCLAIDSHVRDRERLFSILGGLTRELLMFEGNASSDPVLVERSLSECFKKVEFIGYCDDDVREHNNNRPLFRAWK